MKKTSVSELNDFLKALGLKKSDTVLLFSNITTLGLVEGGLHGIYSAFKNVLDEGTLVVPTFTFSFCDGKEFDVDHSKSTCGVFTDFVRQLPEATRSIQPIHSLAAVGMQAQRAIQMTDKSSFGPGSAFTNLLDMDVKVLLLGVIHNTYVHYVEQKHGVEYRYDKAFTGTIVNDGNHYQDTFTYFVRRIDADGTHTRDREPQRKAFFETSFCKEIEFGYGIHRYFKASDFCDHTLKKLSRDPLYLVDKEKYFASLRRADASVQA